MSVLYRLLALVGGLVLLAAAALTTLGTALLAPLAMLILYKVQHARRREVGRGASWVVATGATALGMLALGGATFAAMPSDVRQQARRSFDSASVASQKQPPPAWLERIAPGSAQRAAKAPQLPPAAQTALVVWGTVMGVVLAGALLGSLGWAGGMLLGFCATGRWPSAKPAPAPPAVSAAPA